MIKRLGAILIAASFVLTWGAAIFERGLDFFIEYIGISLFLPFALIFLLLVTIGVTLHKDISGVVKCGSALNIVNGLIVASTVYMLCSVMWSPEFMWGLLQGVRQFWYLCVYGASLIALGWFTYQQRRIAVGYVGLLSFSVLLIGIVVQFRYGLSEIVLNQRDSRFNLSLFNDYNIFTQCMLMAATAAFLLLPRANPRVREVALYIIIVLSIVFIGVVSGSRRALVFYGPIAILMPFAVMMLRRTRLIGAIGALLVVIPLALWGVMHVGNYITKEHASSDNRIIADLGMRATRGFGFITGSYSHTDNRIVIWRNAMDIYEEGSGVQKGFGRGTRAYVADGRFIRFDGARNSPHNFVLGALIEGGVVQLVFTLAVAVGLMVASVVVVAKSDFWMSVAVLVNSLIMVVSVSISGEGLFHSRIVFFCFLLLAVGMSDGRKIMGGIGVGTRRRWNRNANGVQA